ncbi:unnamed protein product [Urochloa humidicola]
MNKISGSCSLGLPKLKTSLFSLHSPWCHKWHEYSEVKVHMVPFTFYNLKSLELSTSFDCTNQMLVMFFLLKSSPNLEKLKLEFREYEDELEHEELLSAQWTNGMCSHLQDVEILSFDYYLPIDFIKLILSKASRLRTLSLEATRLQFSAVSQDNRMNEILTCTRASAESQVLFKDELKHIYFGRSLAY